MDDGARAVIFDLDGVLVDSYEAHYAAWRTTCTEHGIELTEAVFGPVFGCTSQETIAALWPRPVPVAEADAIAAAKDARYRALVAGSLRVVDGADDLVDRLRAAGFRLAVGSSAPPENVAQALARLGRPQRFAAVVTGADVRRGKPDPEVFTRCAARLGVAPPRCVVIEDAPVGVAAAHAAGMACIGHAAPGRRPPEQLAAAELVVASLREIEVPQVTALVGGRAR